ncbi:hypothetical protein MTR67_014763 [Solanum verrucosum]|uniref:Helicase C-terminal domain-containing protein n=1 Tax=Solanum verrucosum TaxID=315347 RepID=A0AAF0QF44_SOLVR|nr:hypothetical protein MTR67_014763 [Solanum verrucosum]
MEEPGVGFASGCNDTGCRLVTMNGEKGRDSSLKAAVSVIIGSPELKANQSIRQVIEVVTDLEKYSRLIGLLKEVMDGSRILIFVETKKGCDQVTRQLRMDGWPALSIHGDKSQDERDWVLADFKTGRSPIMIATDVAARGLGRTNHVKD